MADIVKVDSSARIKAGTVIVSCLPTGRVVKSDRRVTYDLPPIEEIEDKYVDRIDDPTYYTS